MGEGMIIRQATHKDYESISELLKELDIPEINLFVSESKEVKDLISQKMVFLAGDKKVVGAIGLIIEENSAEIYFIVSKEKGTGRKMINFAIKKLRKMGIPKIWAWSLDKYNAKGFYEKMGFNESYLMKKQWSGQDCWIFGKVIG